MKFENLAIGQAIKVKGTSGAHGFTAYDICREDDADETSFEGPIQGISPDVRGLQILDRELTVPEDATIKNLLRDRVPLGELQAGDVVVVKGDYDADSGFTPRKVKREQAYGFAIEQIVGLIEALDADSMTVEVAGVSVTVTDETLIRSH